MKNILFYGWVDYGNIGDDQYKTSFPMLFPNATLHFTNSLNDQIIKNKDILVLGGGNILDQKFVNNISKYKNLLPIYAMSVGCTDDTLTTEQLSIFKKIWARDFRSQKLLESKNIKADYAPDVSWILKPNKNIGLEIWEESFKTNKCDLYDKKIVVVLNGHLTTKQPDVLARDAYRFQEFAYDLASVVDNTSASFAFLPFGHAMPWNDKVPNGWVAHKCKWYKKNIVIWDDWSVQKTLDFMSAADAVISMRFHSSVFSLIAGVPFVDIVHHDKNLGFLEAMNLKDWGVSYWDFNKDSLKTKLDKFLVGKYDSKIITSIRDQQCKEITTYGNKILF